MLQQRSSLQNVHVRSVWSLLNESNIKRTSDATVTPMPIYNQQCLAIEAWVWLLCWFCLLNSPSTQIVSRAIRFRSESFNLHKGIIGSAQIIKLVRNITTAWYIAKANITSLEKHFLSVTVGSYDARTGEHLKARGNSPVMVKRTMNTINHFPMNWIRSKWPNS